jgi:invasion protein IalB
MGIFARAAATASLVGTLAATTAIAQDAEPAETPAEPPPAEAPATDAPPAEAPAPLAPVAPAAPGPAAGDPAAQENQINVRATHGAWEVRCAPDDSECVLYQLARDDQNNPVAELNIVKLAPDAQAAAGVNILTPLGTLLPPGLVLQIDDAQQRQYPFSWCDGAGCFARFAVDQASVDAMKRGSNAKLTLFSVGAPGTPVELDISLSGFTAGFDEIDPLPN